MKEGLERRQAEKQVRKKQEEEQAKKVVITDKETNKVEETSMEKTGEDENNTMNEEEVKSLENEMEQLNIIIRKQTIFFNQISSNCAILFIS